MLKKRVIFTLLYDRGRFMLSRNFRLQVVGDMGWLKKNYDFSQVSFSIDELIVLDVSRENRNIDDFCNALKDLTYGCFVPISAGGGVENLETAFKLLRSGADKIVINSLLFKNRAIVDQLAKEFGQQCLVGSLDLKRDKNSDYLICSENGSKVEIGSAVSMINEIIQLPVGEIYLNSIDRDGTGQGLDLDILGALPSGMQKPVILAGGAGNADHLYLGLKDPRVDAVATANLFNFVGKGLQNSRRYLIMNGINLPSWNPEDLVVDASSRIKLDNDYDQ